MKNYKKIYNKVANFDEDKDLKKFRGLATYVVDNEILCHEGYTFTEQDVETFIYDRAYDMSMGSKYQRSKNLIIGFIIGIIVGVVVTYIIK